MKERPERTRTRGKLFPPALSLQCPLLTRLNIMSPGKQKIFKNPDPFSHIREQRVNLVMKGNKLVTGIVRMVEIIVGKGEYELLAQSFDW